MKKEKRFFEALRDLFVGAKVEGESGFINLMRIKSRYYEKGVLPRLQKDVDEALKPFPGFREELFDKLYTFFSRYFSETGSIYFRYTPLHQNVYEKVYTDDKDVVLFWKTHMLYYVKTDRLFRNLESEVDGFKFFFDVSTLEHKRANEKREIVYEFEEKREDGTLVFAVSYSEKGRKTKAEQIPRELRKRGVQLKEEVLGRAFRVFERQSEVDYFINKNARAFLQEQFNLWLYQYVFSGESEWTKVRIKQLQTLKNIAFKIIDFISQFEDELVKIWNKPKFVLDSNYILTLDKIADTNVALLERLLQHANFLAQLEEWCELGMVDKQFQGSDLLEDGPAAKQLKERYRYLPLDTKHFKDLELEILRVFDDLDGSLDGWLIKSENYQLLRTTLPKFGERFKCIYIDPPYNTGLDGFPYKDRFQHSSWLSMMANRLELAKRFLTSDGIIFVSTDENEASSMPRLMNELFGEENRVETFIWKKSYGGGAKAKYAVNLHEYIWSYANSLSDLGPLRLKPDQKVIKRYYKFKDSKFDTRGPHRLQPLATTSMDARPNLRYPIPYKGREIWPEKQWQWEKGRSFKALAEDELVFIESTDGRVTVNYKQYLKDKQGTVRPSMLYSIIDGIFTQQGTTEVRSLFGNINAYSFPKPSPLVRTLCEASGGPRDYTFDFFAGSGTTAHAVVDLNREDGGIRKYIMVEMADYFDTVMLPRIKKVVFSDKWKDGKALEGGRGISHFAKYYQLEQYEDALRKTKYEDSDLFEDPYRDPYNQYVFLRDMKMLEALEVDLEEDSVKVDLSKLYQNIDLPETISNLTGKWIKRIIPDAAQLGVPAAVEFRDGDVVDLKNIDYRLLKPLIWW